MTFLNVSVVAAQPGHELIYRGDRPHNFEIGGEVLAWRVVTKPAVEPVGSVCSEVEPLVVGGEVSEKCVGVQNPDGTVVMFGDKTYSSWDSYRAVSGCSALVRKSARTSTLRS